MKESILNQDAVKSSAKKTRTKPPSKAGTVSSPKNETEAFDAFWEFVRKAEIDIDNNGNVGCPPPETCGDFWDEEFADAYKAIEPYLRKYVGEYIAYPPKGMTCFSRPHYTKTAHQGLMEVLNPTCGVYGRPGFLRTPEYLAIKESAMSEHRARVADKKKESPDQKKEKQKDNFMTALRRYHAPSKGSPVVKPMTILQIVELMKREHPADVWNYSSVRRLLCVMFTEGIEGYHKMFCKDIDLSGHKDEGKDGSSTYDRATDTNATYLANKHRR